MENEISVLKMKNGKNYKKPFHNNILRRIRKNYNNEEHKTKEKDGWKGSRNPYQEYIKYNAMFDYLTDTSWAINLSNFAPSLA